MYMKIHVRDTAGTDTKGLVIFILAIVHFFL